VPYKIGKNSPGMWIKADDNKGGPGKNPQVIAKEDKGKINSSKRRIENEMAMQEGAHTLIQYRAYTLFHVSLKLPRKRSPGTRQVRDEKQQSQRSPNNERN